MATETGSSAGEATTSSSWLTQSTRLLRGAAMRSATRFTLALVVTTITCVSIFGDSSLCLFGSFAVIGALYFCDFEGTAASQTLAYGALWAVSLTGIIIGVVIAQSTVASVIAATLVASTLAFFRVFRGMVARSSLGVQLAFLMCLLLPAQFTDLWRYLCCWSIGSAVSLVAALVLFPRHHGGKVRDQLARWCTAMGSLAAALVKPANNDKERAAVDDAESVLFELLAEGARWPGVLSRRLRSLTEMALGALGTTVVLEQVKEQDVAGDPSGATLASATQSAFDLAATEVVHRGASDALIPVDAVRHHDLGEVITWTGTHLGGDPSSVLAQLETHHALRVLSIASDEMQRLATASEGHAVAAAEIGMADVDSAPQIVRQNLSRNSFWLRDALRSGIALGGAVAIARILGISHGVWVALAALVLLQSSSTPNESQRQGVKVVIGSIAGMLLGAALLSIESSARILIVALVLSAFWTRRQSFYGPFGAQASFSFFAIVNMSVLNWPPDIQTATVRFEDVAIGIAVAAIATVLVFPRGPASMLAAARTEALGAADRLMGSMAEWVVAVDRDPASLRALRDASAAASFRYRDLALEVGGALEPGSDLARTLIWLREVVTGADILESIGGEIDDDATRALVGHLLGAAPQHRQSTVEGAVLADPTRYSQEPQAVVAALWTAQWLDQLGERGAALDRSA